MGNSVDDTICAIATPVGEGGIGIVRISGAHAIDIAAHVVRPRNKPPLQQLESHRLYLSDVLSPKFPLPSAGEGQGEGESEGSASLSLLERGRGEGPTSPLSTRWERARVRGKGEDPAQSEEPPPAIDEALVVIMRKPRSYTGEDVVEIQTHGGAWILQATCHSLIQHGARLAQPGEFTKRAFLNGRLDLTQAEAVLDTIQATTARSLQAAQSLMRGALSKEVDALRERLIRVLAHVEAGMDFAEEDITFIQAAEVQQALTDTQQAVERLIASYEEGRLIREGIKVAIIGRPNVGKSSLLNALLKLDRAIVSDQPGTTRDVIDESLNVRGIPLRLLDTAGLRQTQDRIEGEGIRRTEDAIAEADVLLLVLDGSEGVTDEDLAVFKTYGSRRHLLVVNKMDLPESRTFDTRSLPLPPVGEGQGEGSSSLSPRWERARVRGKGETPSQGEGEAPSFIKISAKTGEGFDQLTSLIHSVCLKESLEAAPSVLVTRLRHKASLEQAHRAVEEAMLSLERKESGECVALDIRAALDALGEITGAVSTEYILDRIFQYFCIGK
ncbi:MAG: tRNA uridine-5-carboxymethylaminomethyl(34) synthesis GTPase MnmE [Nitrospira sp. SB0677_bin_15]|nr:tRNA uridine-5-carboxymethylaminomethyl(34) synthesis GTPase MnmE [Nitrospira sp. SB0677_bin_15]MYH02602.1 tRNA uridine-5-carboxymethylaminomethyl(34) synthesis GTPase MnmE [Nitrospira sp. SB0675_bin_23]